MVLNINKLFKIISKFTRACSISISFFNAFSSFFESPCRLTIFTARVIPVDFCVANLTLPNAPLKAINFKIKREKKSINIKMQELTNLLLYPFQMCTNFLYFPFFHRPTDSFC